MPQTGSRCLPAQKNDRLFRNGRIGTFSSNNTGKASEMQSKVVSKVNSVKRINCDLQSAVGSQPIWVPRAFRRNDLEKVALTKAKPGRCHATRIDRTMQGRQTPGRASRRLSRRLPCSFQKASGLLCTAKRRGMILSQHTPTTKVSTAMARNPRASYLPLLSPSKNLATAIKEKVNGSATQVNDCSVRRYSNSFASSRNRTGIILYQYTATARLISRA
jgi:hypothetical protein